ncbi:hypothetical protein [Pseudomonas sp. MWU13-2100]|uniref:hypothetical protein n=1 Tax=Pseudomonas sp. MWU13-2100 TaxID=2935075 RepID=UPI002010393D|nr:hypothetical protein [Pseudomonas sp. MWU13-2100]
MQQSLNDMSFSERRRVPIGALILGLLVLPLAIQAFRMEAVGKFAYVLLLCSLYMFVAAFLNRKAGSTPLMILKDEGVWFFNADGLVPYTSIQAVEVETYNTLKDIQRNLVLHIHAEKADTLPHFNNKRWKLLFMMPDARKGRGFRKHLVAFNYGGLCITGGQSADPDVLAEEIVYRIGKAHHEEEARQGAIWVSSSSANDALSPVQS